jgi:hypothetical protein
VTQYSYAEQNRPEYSALHMQCSSQKLLVRDCALVMITNRRTYSTSSTTKRSHQICDTTSLALTVICPAFFGDDVERAKTARKPHFSKGIVTGERSILKRVTTDAYCMHCYATRFGDHLFVFH